MNDQIPFASVLFGSVFTWGFPGGSITCRFLLPGVSGSKLVTSKVRWFVFHLFMGCRQPTTKSFIGVKGHPFIY